jgi:hypothetical protein
LDETLVFMVVRYRLTRLQSNRRSGEVARLTECMPEVDEV